MAPRKTLSGGLFLTFEGIEGSGKSTQSEKLADRLEHEGWSVVRTREPGGTKVGAAIRTVFLNPDHHGMHPWTELLLINADRRQHVEEVIRPALARGAIVVCDRFVDSTRAYQGGGRGLGIALVDELHQECIGGLMPYRTWWLEIPVETGLARSKTRQGGIADRIEQDGLDFHRRIHETFAAIAKAEPQRVMRVDGMHGLEEIRLEIWNDAARLLG